MARAARCWRHGAGSQRIAPVKVQAVDTTGAGDAFIGSFARYLAGGLALEAALAEATRYSAFSVTRHGAQKSFATEAEFAAFSATLELRGARRLRSGTLFANFLADIHSVRIAGQLALKSAFVVAAAFHLNRLHPLDRLVSAVAECLEARGHVEPGPVGAIRIDDRGPFAGCVVTSSEHEKTRNSGPRILALSAIPVMAFSSPSATNSLPRAERFCKAMPYFALAPSRATPAPHALPASRRRFTDAATTKPGSSR